MDRDELDAQLTRTILNLCRSGRFKKCLPLLREVEQQFPHASQASIERNMRRVASSLVG